ncbi:hypothetical protein [Enterobacter phage N5822]|nr:hypothetical protein [Enterobacter phage N5822]
MVTDKGDYLEYYERDPSDTRKEDSHQVDCVAWLRHHHPHLLFWHTVNEGARQSPPRCVTNRPDCSRAYPTLLS